MLIVAANTKPADWMTAEEERKKMSMEGWYEGEGILAEKEKSD